MSMTNPLLSVVRGQQPLSAHAMPPRAYQHMQEIMVDTRIASRGAPAHAAFERALDAGDPSLDVTDFIGELWNAKCNEDLVREFMEIPLCFDAAEGKPAALEAYKDYAAQDFYYLTNYVTFKVLRYLQAPENHSISAETAQAQVVLRDAQYALSWLDTCESELGIDMNATTPNAAVKQYNNYLNSVALSDNWFSLHVVLIACNYGWSKLALSLYKDDMNKTTDFYKYWLAGSINLTNPEEPTLSSHALKLNSFLSQNAGHYGSRLQTEDTNMLSCSAPA